MLIAFLDNRRSALAGMSLLIAVLVGCGREPTTPTEILEESYKVGDWESVVSMSMQILQEDPQNADALLKLGQAHLAVGEYDAAVNDFTRLIALRPEDPEPYFGRESAYVRLGKLDMAMTDGQAARERDPSYKSAYAYAPSNFVEPLDIGDAPYVSEDGEAPGDSTDASIAGDKNDRRSEFEQEEGLDERSSNRGLLSETEGNDSDAPPHSVVATPTEPTEPKSDASLPGESSIPRPNIPSANIPQPNIPRPKNLDPKAPTVVHENHVPKMHLNGEPKPADAASDGPEGIADLGQVRFPIDPDDQEEPAVVPDDQPESDPPAPNSGLTNSLPIDEFGNVMVPDSSAGKMGTGLTPNGLGNVSPSTFPSSRQGLSGMGLSGMGLSDGSPSLSTGGFTAINPIVPDPTLNPGFGTALGNPLPGQPTTGINGPMPPQNTGYSGLPIPTNGSTGLPPGNAAGTGFTPRTLIGFGPATTQFRGNPIYTPSQQPVISTSLPGFQAPNQPSPRPAVTSGGPAISTSLSDAALQDRLRGPVAPTPSTQKLRSIQP